jgi:hypothetical protein
MNSPDREASPLGRTKTRGSVRLGRSIAISVAALSGSAIADNLSFAPEMLRARSVLEGLLDISALQTWNGEPVSPTNQPSEYHRRLSVVCSIYESEALDGTHYVVISDVVTTQSAWWSGTIFIHTLMTGLSFSVPDASGLPIELEAVSFQHANIGQHLLDSNGETPVDETAGFVWEATAAGAVIRTVNGANYSFAEYGSVTGVVITEGGGVMEITPVDPPAADWIGTVFHAEFGLGNQVLTATPCTVELPSLSINVEAEGGTFSTPTAMHHAACEWVAVSEADWIMLSGDPTASGTTDAVEFVVAPNLGAQARAGTVAIGDARLLVQQEPSPCPADLDGDGMVGGSDVAALLGSWGLSGSDLIGDIDANGFINGGDLAVLLSSWGACS